MMELAEAMSSQHACRYYTDEPVPEAAFYRAVELARYAPQGGNRQPVRFLVVTDPDKKKQLAEWYLVPWKAYMARALSQGGDAIEASSGDAKATWLGMTNPEKSLADADNFAENYANHPAIVVVVADLDDTHPTDTDLGRSVDRRRRLRLPGGTQNFCLALRDQGVATTFTTLAVYVSSPRSKSCSAVPR
jgi:nitroreductase